MCSDPHLPSDLPALLPVADITRADAGQMPVLAACHFLGSDRVTLSELRLTGWLRAVSGPSAFGPRPLWFKQT